MTGLVKPGRPLLISFSGLDGSGKSTQIQAVVSLLRSLGMGVHQLAFWDDVVVLTRYREGFVHKLYKSERGVGTPGKPVQRRDKNMRGWPLTGARHLLYLLDALHLRRVLARERRSGCDVIVIDRYIYDELANLPLYNSASRTIARIIAQLAPRPDLALLLDAEPEAAHARKPEYPVAFMRECRLWYHRLAELLGTMTIIPPLPLEEGRRAVTDALRNTLAAAGEVAALGLPRSA
jgi:thymidylate kinase